jgi:hypothetical protein
MSIPPIARPVLDYFSRFDLSAVGLTRDNRLVSTRNPAGLQCAWWGRAVDVGMVLERAKADSLDVVKAARQLKVRVVEHPAAMQRVEELVKRLDARMSSARQEGELALFNKSYKEYRQRRFVAGKPSMTYAQARSRLRAALAEVAAGKAPPSGIIARVFDDRPPDPQ